MEDGLPCSAFSQALEAFDRSIRARRQALGHGWDSLVLFGEAIGSSWLV